MTNLPYFGQDLKSKKKVVGILAHVRHVPGSQTPFYLIPDPDQNKEDTSFISVVAWCVYIPLSRTNQFCPVPDQNFELNAKDPADPAEPWIQDPKGVLPIFVVFKSFHQRNPLSYETLLHGQSSAMG